ncbi:MAG TPA: alpha/beta hydrolase [Candidatus Binatus sp.]|jgi:pimeloyl-ACP methyl ester carboxylesterase|nr:alpha/beta hydrolase [Candidatus Binatus sp.]
MFRTHRLFQVLLFLPLAMFSFEAQLAHAASDSESAPAIVIAFVGGFVSPNDAVHSEVELANRLRREYPSGVYVQVFDNRHVGEASKKIVELLDTRHSGKLTDDQKKNARIIIYGHSWGGSAAVKLARQLGAAGIPVLLTIQIDSVAKFHEDDSLIPSNVEAAANFYQPYGRLHGRAEIRAADPSRTRIIGNYRFDYKTMPVDCYGDYPWWDRHLTKAHTEIECDPQVWNQVESLIRSSLSAPGHTS